MPSSPKIKPCPFCGGECGTFKSWTGDGCHVVECKSDDRKCTYDTPWRPTEAEAIAAHNRVAGAVEEVARLREALEFYTGWPLQDDEGERARAALGEGSP